jgi:hypothetical protein
MPSVTEPLPRETALLLREAVRRHVIGERRRRFAPVVHLGRPAGHQWHAPAAVGASDHALRTDVMGALLAQVGDRPHLVWLTRPGELVQHDVDAAWLSASASAYGESGRDLSFVVVTRRGWWDPRSGVRREWRRMRP